MKKDKLGWWDIANHLSRGYRLDQLREEPKVSREGLETTIIPGDARSSEYWGTMSAYIGLGSNLGDREENLLDAIELLKPYHHSSTYERDTVDDEFLMKENPILFKNLVACKDARQYELEVSSFYETTPVDCQDPDAFLNAVIKIQTRLDPNFLLETLQKIEFNLGRERSYINAPRSIDLDLLCYAGGCWVVNSDTLTLPHPRMRDRAFVLVPLAEIEPDLFIRECQQTGKGYYVADRLKEISTEGVKKWCRNGSK